MPRSNPPFSRPRSTPPTAPPSRASPSIATPRPATPCSPSPPARRATRRSHADDPGADAFAAALGDLCRQLAHLVVRDGEGATKFVTVEVYRKSGGYGKSVDRRVDLGGARILKK